MKVLRESRIPNLISRNDGYKICSLDIWRRSLARRLLATFAVCEGELEVCHLSYHLPNPLESCVMRD
jgi:hypothetical protein